MDDILYIILGVAWLAWSLYSNKQKLDKKRLQETQRQAEVQRPVTSQSETTRMESDNYGPVQTKPVKQERSILEEIFSEYTEHEEAQQDIYEPEVDEKSWQSKIEGYKKPEAQSLEVIDEEVTADYFSKRYSEQYKTGEQRVINTIRDEIHDNDITESGNELQPEFDLRKAVIYSEILRAPYISGTA